MKTLIFDFDGTLADSFKLVYEIGSDLLHLPPLSKAEQDELRQLPPRQVLKRLGISLLQVPRLVVMGRKRMHARMHEVKPFAGIADMLQKLHERGHTMLLISSNSEANVRTFLRANALDTYFKSLHGGIGLFDKTVAIRKALRHNQLAAADCFYIGDEVRDIMGAKRAHVPCISVAWGYQKPALLTAKRPFAVAKTPADLLEIVAASQV